MMPRGWPFTPHYKGAYCNREWSDPPETLDEIKAYAVAYHKYVGGTMETTAPADIHGPAMDAEHITFSPDEGTTTWRRLRETAWCVRCGTDLGPRAAMSFPYTCGGACQDWTPFENLAHRPEWWARYCEGEAVPSPDVPGDHRPLPIKWKVALDRFIPDHYARSTIPLRVEDIYAVLSGVFNDFSNTVLDEFPDLMRDHGDWVQHYVETRLQKWHDGNARRRMAALRICRFLRDTTCNPIYAACRRRVEAYFDKPTTGKPKRPHDGGDAPAGSKKSKTTSDC